MDGYDQLWSLVEADGADDVPGLISEAVSLSGSVAEADAAPPIDLQVDVPALKGLADGSWPHGALLAGSWSTEDDFFPIHAPASVFEGATFDGVTSTDETPLVLPAAPDVAGTPEPLVLPGLMADEFIIPREQGGPRLRAETPHGLQLVDPADNAGDWAMPHSPYDALVDHAPPVGDHGLIGAHGTDDWLL